jgi:hypothetical protein
VPCACSVSELRSFFQAVPMDLFFGHLSVFARLGAGLGLYLIALLAPSFLSISVGIVLSAFALLVMLTNLWFRNYRHKGRRLILSAFVFPGIYCLIYWWVVIVIRSGP